nr:phosphoribosylanthranilate isomerase [Dysgonomonas hofstadii]
MKIKVCGMKYSDNIKELSLLPIDYMGLIFYDKSPRYIDSLNGSDVDAVPQTIKLAGVFVDAEIEYIAEKTVRYGLDIIQLHGNETPGFCKDLNRTMPVIKAISVADAADLEKTKQYEGAVDYLLFDTKTSQHGGSGQKFDWNILHEYKGNTPFFLSGGISIDDAEKIRGINHPGLYAIDLNSKFEIRPGLKDIQLLEKFIKQL